MKFRVNDILHRKIENPDQYNKMHGKIDLIFTTVI